MVQPGQCVWVADERAPGGRAFGRVVSLDKPGYLSDGGGFVVRLEAGNVVVACSTARRGSQWDFIEE